MYARVAGGAIRCYVDGEWPGGARRRDVPAARRKGLPPFHHMDSLQLGHQTSPQDHGDSSRCGVLATIALGRDAISSLASALSRARLHASFDSLHRAASRPQAAAFVRSSHHSSSYDTLQQLLQRCQARGGSWPPVPWCAPAAAPTITHRIDGASPRGARQAMRSASRR